MSGHQITYAVGINTKQNNQENNNISFGRLEGLRNTKGGFGRVLVIKAKKGKNFSSAGRFGLRL